MEKRVALVFFRVVLFVFVRVYVCGVGLFGGICEGWVFGFWSFCIVFGVVCVVSLVGKRRFISVGIGISRVLILWLGFRLGLLGGVFWRLVGFIFFVLVTGDG